MGTDEAKALGKRAERLRKAASVFRGPTGHIGALVKQANATADMIEALIPKEGA